MQAHTSLPPTSSPTKFLPKKSALVARPVITKHHTSGGLNNGKLGSHSSGGWKSKIKLSAELVPSEAGGESIPGLSPSCWLVAGWRSLVVVLACRQLVLIPAFIFTRHPPCVSLHPNFLFNKDKVILG